MSSAATRRGSRGGGGGRGATGAAGDDSSAAAGCCVLAVYRLPPAMGAQQLVYLLEQAGPRISAAYVEPGSVEGRGMLKLVSRYIEGF